MSGRPIEGFGGRTWAELDIVEHANGQLMFPAVIKRRLPSGELRENPVRVRVPSPDDEFEARKLARRELKRRELDEDRDKDLFEKIEQLEILALAVRTHAAPHAQFQPARDYHDYDEGSLRAVQEQITQFKAELDPRDRVQTDDEFWRLVVDVARSASIGPLVDTDGRDQPLFVVRMALELCRSPIASSWLQSFGISMPERSASTTSDESSGEADSSES
jgi:hypothetical protein